MENEEKNNQENNQKEDREEVNQEELAKQWEEALQQQEEEKKEENSEEVNQEELAKQWEEALQQQNTSTEETQGANQEELAKQWEEALQEQSKQNKSEGYMENEKLELLFDIPLEISVEIGQKNMSLEEVLKLNPNAILELNKYINEPVDIKINGKLVAKGELYTVENNFGIKITNIITVQERLKLLMEEGGE